MHLVNIPCIFRENDFRSVFAAEGRVNDSIIPRRIVKTPESAVPTKEPDFGNVAGFFQNRNLGFFDKNLDLNLNWADAAPFSSANSQQAGVQSVQSPFDAQSFQHGLPAVRLESRPSFLNADNRQPPAAELFRSNTRLQHGVRPLFANENADFRCDPPKFQTAASELGRCLQYPDDPVYVFIMAREKKNIDIAQSSRKWVFSPQTEKKVVALAARGKRVFLVYYVRSLQNFMGIAEYRTLHIGKKYSKPTASIAWIYSTPLPRVKTRQLLNPYNDAKPIYESDDGAIIQQQVGEELMRIFAGTEETLKKSPSPEKPPFFSETHFIPYQ